MNRSFLLPHFGAQSEGEDVGETTFSTLLFGTNIYLSISPKMVLVYLKIIVTSSSVPSSSTVAAVFVLFRSQVSGWRYALVSQPPSPASARRMTSKVSDLPRKFVSLPIPGRHKAAKEGYTCFCLPRRRWTTRWRRSLQTIWIGLLMRLGWVDGTGVVDEGTWRWWETVPFPGRSQRPFPHQHPAFAVPFHHHPHFHF